MQDACALFSVDIGSRPSAGTCLVPVVRSLLGRCARPLVQLLLFLCWGSLSSVLDAITPLWQGTPDLPALLFCCCCFGLFCCFLCVVDLFLSHGFTIQPGWPEVTIQSRLASNLEIHVTLPWVLSLKTHATISGLYWFLGAILKESRQAGTFHVVIFNPRRHPGSA